MSDETAASALLEHVPDAILVVGRDGVIHEATGAIEAVLGWPADELSGQSLEVLLPASARHAHGALVHAFFESGTKRDMRDSRGIQARHRNGTLFPADVRLAPHGDFVVAVLRDVTRRAAAEAQVRETNETLVVTNQELQRVGDERNRALGVAAHDLRNPLQITFASLDLILDGICGPVSGEQGRLLTKVIESVEYMSALVDDLLEFSREGGTLHLDREEVELPALILSACELMAPAARRKSISLKVEVPAFFPLAEVDGTKIRQVVQNLVGNAIKYSPRDRSVRVSLIEEDGSACLQVQDEGPGLHPHEVLRIFEPFERGEGQPTGGEVSTGLGLSIVDRIVRGHGGKIGVDSTPGHGSTFEVCLPLAVALD